MTLSEFLLGILSSLILDEFLQWSRRLAHWFIRRSAHMLPKDLQERMHEEWLAHAEAIPGRFSRLLFAVDTLRAGCIVGHYARLPEIPLWKMAVKRGCDVIIAGVSIVLLMPLFVIITLGIWIANGSAKKIFFHDYCLGRDGKIYTCRTFKALPLKEKTGKTGSSLACPPLPQNHLGPGSLAPHFGDHGPSDSALAAARGWRLRRPAADWHAACCASRDLCSGARHSALCALSGVPHAEDYPSQEAFHIGNGL
jgi:hypothetical protein